MAYPKSYEELMSEQSAVEPKVWTGPEAASTAPTGDSALSRGPAATTQAPIERATSSFPAVSATLGAPAVTASQPTPQTESVMPPVAQQPQAQAAPVNVAQAAPINVAQPVQAAVPQVAPQGPQATIQPFDPYAAQRASLQQFLSSRIPHMGFAGGLRRLMAAAMLSRLPPPPQ